MIHLKDLEVLKQHIDYVSKKLGKPGVFLVGGCVRDVLLGVSDIPNDLDVTLAGQPKAVAAGIDHEGISFFMTEKYGTMTIIPKEQKVEPKIQYEITPFRTESGYTDQRHPDQVNWTDNLVLDAQRRDFTVNAMYFTYVAGSKKTKKPANTDEVTYDADVIAKHMLKEGVFVAEHLHTVILGEHSLITTLFPAGQFDEKAFDEYMTKNFPDVELKAFKSVGISFVIDPYMGLVDMIQRKLKAVGDPEKRIEEDALRVLRAIRFVNVLNDKLNVREDKHFFDVEKMTWKAVKKNYYRLQNVAKERLKTEIDKAFSANNPFGFIGMLDEINVLKYLFPALYETKNVKQPVRYHPFDVYTHSMLTLHELQSINCDRLTKYAMLYHDVGKTEQYYTYEMGLDQDEARTIFGTWLNHVICGVDMVKKDFRALGFSNKEIDEISWQVANHMKPGEILMAMQSNWKKKLRKLLSDGGEDRVRNLLDITIGDRLGQYNPVQPPAIEDVQLLEEILDELIAEEGQFTMKALAVNGQDLMDELNMEPGPALGEQLTKAFDWVIDDIANRNTKEEIIKYLKK